MVLGVNIGQRVNVFNRFFSVFTLHYKYIQLSYIKCFVIIKDKINVTCVEQHLTVRFYFKTL